MKEQVDQRGAPAGGETPTEIRVTNPATGEMLAMVPTHDERAVNRAVLAAREAFEAGWGDSTPAERSILLTRLADLVEDHAEELAEIEMSDVGKPRSVARTDVASSLNTLRFFAGATRLPEGKAVGEYASGYTSMLRREPVGVVAAITPWNFPLMIGVWKIGAALAAGNTVVIKPSEITPLSTIRLAEISHDLLPDGVLNVVTGFGQTTGAALVGHPGIAMISLTGGVTTGKAVARTAAEHLKRVHLELGGKAPMMVFEDADLDAVVEGIRVGGYYNSGQDCTASCRILVHNSRYDALLQQLTPAVDSLVVGDPHTGDVDMGPVVSEAHRHRVGGFVERARDRGAEVLAGGQRIEGPGFFYAPTLIAGVEQHDEIVQREVFGPVVTVQPFGDDDEAIRIANDVPYGLAASAWTESVTRALDIVRRLNFGVVWVNDHGPGVSEMPHGGFGESGYGKEKSQYSVEEFTRVKHVMARIQ